MKIWERIRGKSQQASSRKAPARPQARMLRDTKSRVLESRRVPLIDSRDEIRRSWSRAASYALDFIQNSGSLKGACDQVLADTVGVELVLHPQPDLISLGYSEEETIALVAEIKKRWKRYAWNPSECDLRGKFTIPQLVDIALRWYIAYGEVTGVLTYMTRDQRRRYGITAGTKVCLMPPNKLVQDTSELEGLFQGIYHDENGRPVGYLFEEKQAGFTRKVAYPSKDQDGRHVAVHIFDPVDATDVRGISVLSSAFRKHAQHEVLGDATLQTAILQTVFAAVLTSSSPSAEAFEALEAMSEGMDKAEADELKSDYLGFFQSKLDKARESELSIGGDPTVAHLGMDEDFQFRTAATPGNNYLAFSASLMREVSRAIGITYGSYSMDYSAATYSSVRMEMASIWPIVMRRRERIAGPLLQMIYENWLDEEIGEGRLRFKGGYSAFRANRDKVTWALWQGPAAPNADDYKSERAVSERLENGTSSLAIECALKGVDPDELFEQRVKDHERYLNAGMVSPYAPRGQAPLPVDDPPQKQKEKT